MIRLKISSLIIFVLLLQSGIAAERYPRLSDVSRIENDLRIITKTLKSRNYKNIPTLNFVAEYIHDELSKTCDTVYYQTFYVNGVEYQNVIARIGQNALEKVVVGAHYDVAGEQEGADDNASGIVGLLELSRIISKNPVNYQIEFVAYSLEEPPFFRTKNMGSYIHAKSLYENGSSIKGMICFDMIGYFCDSKNCQTYPVGLLKLFYGKKGDFITVVQKFGNGNFGRQVKRKMKKTGMIKTKSFKGPAKLPGIDFSDHINYWKYGFKAVMITNTAFYRNSNYHRSSDTMETLDLNSMSLVIDEVYYSIKDLK